ncbi:transposase [Streptomyces sp. PSKA30]|uniref:transposase n=1 Tax=Streptomyces sp. PSKA30 TaxID=2874597 RepID=UPI001CD095EE|nr:transposase [Streptomyces sp. PSKA30]MBZ9645638.1 transposase [Streptomyces sp. PSKA30]
MPAILCARSATTSAPSPSRDQLAHQPQCSAHQPERSAPPGELLSHSQPLRHHEFEPHERPPSPREAARWIITATNRHGPPTAQRLQRLLEHCPELRRTHDLVRQFAAMLDARDAAPLPDWLDKLSASGLAPLAGIATALREDQHAVTQGITTPYNSGVNEGRITDVKLQKRFMGGHASVPLLRHRVILIARLRRRYTDRSATGPR